MARAKAPSPKQVIRRLAASALRRPTRRRGSRLSAPRCPLRAGQDSKRTGGKKPNTVPRFQTPAPGRENVVVVVRRSSRRLPVDAPFAVFPPVPEFLAKPSGAWLMPRDRPVPKRIATKYCTPNPMLVTRLAAWQCPVRFAQRQQGIASYKNKEDASGGSPQGRGRKVVIKESGRTCRSRPGPYHELPLPEPEPPLSHVRAISAASSFALLRFLPSYQYRAAKLCP